MRDTISGDIGFFRWGSAATCYGQCTSGVSAKLENGELYDALKSTHLKDCEVQLPFDPAQIVENLRLERYMNHLGANHGRDHQSSPDSQDLLRRYGSCSQLRFASTFRRPTLVAGENCNSLTGRWISRWIRSTNRCFVYRWKPVARDASHLSGSGPRAPLIA